MYKRSVILLVEFLLVIFLSGCYGEYNLTGASIGNITVAAAEVYFLEGYFHLDPETPTTGTDISCTGVVSDDANNGPNYYWTVETTWYKNAVEFSNTSQEFISGSFNYGSNPSDYFFLSVDKDELTVGDNWTCNIIGTDIVGTTDFGNYSFIIGENIAPNTTSVFANSTNNRTSDNLKCYAKATDEASYHSGSTLMHQNVIMNYTWYNGSEQSLSGQASILFNTTQLVNTLNSSYTNVGENWTCSVKAYDGITYEDDWNNASPILILSSHPPNITQIIINTTGLLNRSSENITCYINVTDQVDEVILVNYTGLGSGQRNVTTGNLTLIATYDPPASLEHVNYTCRVNAFDNSDYSGWSNATIQIYGPDCGQSIGNGQSVTLVGDITGCSGNGIILGLAASLDCQGHTISGMGQNGIYSQLSGPDNPYTLTVKNCIIENFSHGVLMEVNWDFGGLSNDNIVLENNTFINGDVNIEDGVQSIVNNTFNASETILSGVGSLIEGNSFYASRIYGYTNNSNYINNQFNNSNLSLCYSGNTGNGNFFSGQIKDCVYSDATNYFYNTKFDASENLELSAPGTRFYFVNSSYNNLSTSVGSLALAKFLWYVDINVTNSSGWPLENVSIVVYDTAGYLENVSATNASGLAKLAITEFLYQGSRKYYVVPHQIIISKNGYIQKVYSLNLYNTPGASINFSLSRLECDADLQNSVQFGSDLNCADQGLSLNNNSIVVYGNNYLLNGANSAEGILITANSTVVQNLSITNFTKGISLQYVNSANLTKLVISNNTYGIIFNHSNNNNVYNSVLANNTLNVWASNTEYTNNSLINTSVDINTINVSGTASVYLKWYIDVNVSYNGGIPLGSALITAVRNESGIGEDSGVTDSSGRVRLVLSQLMKNATGVYNMTPHNLTVSFYDAQNSTIVTVNNNSAVHLALSLNCSSPDVSNVTESANFCPGRFNTSQINVTASNIILNCLGTVLFSKSSAYNTKGLYITGNNVSINGCTLNSYDVGIYAVSVRNLRVNNTVLNSTSISLYNTTGSLLTNFSISLGRLYLDYANATTIELGDLYGPLSTCLELRYSNNSIIKNNSFNCHIGISSYAYSSNNLVYHNIFESSFRNIFASGGELLLNTSVDSFPQGNQYFDYCGKGSDANSDSYADNSSSSSEWPYSSSISNKIVGAIDYGPKITACLTEVFLGDTPSSSNNVEEGSSFPAAAPVTQSPAVTDVGSSYAPEEARKYLRLEDASLEQDAIKITLENTGTKRMILFPLLEDQGKDSLLVIQSKTLGRKGSFLDKVVGIFYSDNVIAGRLLKASLVNPEQIILEPGEKIEKTLQIKDELSIPREVKIVFTTTGEKVVEKNIAINKTVVSGIALDQYDNFVDLYVVIVPKANNQSYHSPLTGAVIGFSQETGTYSLEVSLVKNNKPAFVDFYGPYKAGDQTFVLGQQYEYNPKIYKGNYTINTKLYLGNKLIAESNKNVTLG